MVSSGKQPCPAAQKSLFEAALKDKKWLQFNQVNWKIKKDEVLAFVAEYVLVTLHSVG